MWFSKLLKAFKKEKGATIAEINAKDKEIIERNARLAEVFVTLIVDTDLLKTAKTVCEELRFLICSHKDEVIEKDKMLTVEIERIISLLNDTEAPADNEEIFKLLNKMRASIKIRNAEL